MITENLAKRPRLQFRRKPQAPLNKKLIGITTNPLAIQSARFTTPRLYQGVDFQLETAFCQSSGTYTKGRIEAYTKSGMSRNPTKVKVNRTLESLKVRLMIFGS
jgi:hypothetical protein